MQRAALVLILAGTMAACGSGEPASPSPAPMPHEPPAEPARPPPPEAPAPSRPSPAARPTHQPEAVVRSRRAELAAARAVATRGDWAEAVRAFDALIEHTGGSPRILCEAGYVNHRAGDDEKAGRLLDRGLERFDAMDEPIREDLRAPFAMCLYNRGLVDEAAGELGAAAESYDRSLELRPNDVVRRRFDALPVEVRRAADTTRRVSHTQGPGTGGWEEVSDLQTALEMAERVDCHGSEQEESDDSRCDASPGELIEGEGRSFQLIDVSSSCCMGESSWGTTEIFVIVDGRYRRIGSIEQPMDMGGLMSVDAPPLSAHAQQLVPGGPIELAFEATEGTEDSEDGFCATSTTRQGFCVDHRGELTCRVFTVEDVRHCYQANPYVDENASEEEEFARDRRGSIRFLDDGRVHVEGELCVPPGDYSVADLFDRPCEPS